ncbi:hypothetical protein EDC94DRAFT_688628 [Helicostylum pulchrum]|nr:hypothetical protein EDC94DRAFT_688628 [Helicostylum pulchrum]
MNSKLVKDVASKYCYRLVYQGSPEWPNDITLAGTIKEQITMFCLLLRNLLNSQMTLSTLSNPQKNFVPFLLHILSKLEEEHQSYNSFDVRLPLQKLPSILPRASLHWRFIALNIGYLATFVKEKKPKGFNGQIGMFYRISNFKKLRYKK